MAKRRVSILDGYAVEIERRISVTADAGAGQVPVGDLVALRAALEVPDDALVFVEGGSVIFEWSTVEMK